MEAQGKLLEEILLGNGLTLRFYDQSRRIAGNRCQVRLLIVVPVPVHEEYFEKLPDPPPAFREFTGAFGDTIHFTLEKVRNFVAEEEANIRIEEMIQEFLEANRAYISNEWFAQRFVLKKYTEWKEEEGYRRSYLGAMRKAEPER